MTNLQYLQTQCPPRWLNLSVDIFEETPEADVFVQLPIEGGASFRPFQIGTFRVDQIGEVIELIKQDPIAMYVEAGWNPQEIGRAVVVTVTKKLKDIGLGDL